MITGGDALVLATGAAAHTWEINGKPAHFAQHARVPGGIAGAAPGQSAIAGLLTNLPLGKSTVTVKSVRSAVSIEVVTTRSQDRCSRVRIRRAAVLRAEG